MSTLYTDGSRPEHLADKYRVYALRFENGSLVKLHVSQPVSFKTFCETYIFSHLELASAVVGNKARTALATANICAIEKIPNSNKPDFQVTPSGELIEIK